MEEGELDESQNEDSLHGDIDIEEEPDLSDSLIIDPNADQWGRSYEEDSDQDGYDRSEEDEDGDIQLDDGYDYTVDFQSLQHL